VADSVTGGCREKVFNARVLYADGMIKGNCVAVDDATMDRLHGDADIVTHAANLKTELTGWHNVHVGLDPHPPKDEVRTDLQSMVNLPQLFRDAKEWVSDFARKVLHHIASGEVLDTFDRLNRIADNEEDWGGNLYTQSRWTALEFVASGHDLRHSPALVERLFDAHVKGSFYLERGKVNVPVPCAWRMQVISASAARLLGYDVSADWGQIRVTADGQFAVVTDEDWLEMLPSHGGCDMDDSFSLYFRTIGGCKRVVVLRSPNDLGEYSVFDYVDGDPFPVSVRYAGKSLDDLREEAVSWPEVDLAGAPERLSEAVAAGRVKVKGLPEVAYEPRAYDAEAVKDDVVRALAGTSPGGYVNAKMLQALTVGTHLPELPATMEQVVDACVQGGSREALLSVRAFARGVFEGVLKSKAPVDRTFWAAKGFERNLKKDDPRPELVDGWLTQLFAHLNKVYAGGRALLAKKAQEWHTVPDCLVLVAHGEAEAARELLKAFRSRAYDLSRAKAGSEAWDELHAWLAGKVKDVRAFAHAVHTTKTYGKVISDGVLWSKAMFPRYLRALES
jgi:hypothetical protein